MNTTFIPAPDTLYTVVKRVGDTHPVIARIVGWAMTGRRPTPLFLIVGDDTLSVRDDVVVCSRTTPYLSDAETALSSVRVRAFETTRSAA